MKRGGGRAGNRNMVYKSQINVRDVIIYIYIYISNIINHKREFDSIKTDTGIRERKGKPINEFTRKKGEVHHVSSSISK